MEVGGDTRHNRGRLGSGRMEEIYGGRNLALISMMEAYPRNNHSYEEVLKHLTILALALNRGEDGLWIYQPTECLAH